MNDKNRLYLIVSALRKDKYRLCAGLILCMVLFCCISYVRSFQTAQIRFSFNYEEASKGLNPNGTYFNAYEMKSEEVLNRALELAGVTELSADDLADNLYIESSQGNQADYIVTQYKVIYKKNKELKAVKTENMLQMVAYAYQEYFYREYTDNRESLRYNPGTFDNLEYRQIATYYYTKLSQMKKYLETRQSSGASFAGSDGTTFQSLIGEINNLLQIKLTNFRSYVTENGLYKQKDEFLQVLEYKNYQDSNIYTLNDKTRALYEACIAMYDPKLTGIVLVPSVDGNQDFYMSKTKTGIDHLAENAVSAGETSKEKLEEIKSRQLMIDSIAQASNGIAETDKADDMMMEMNQEIKRISQKALALDNEYSRYKNKDYITARILSIGLIQRINPVRAIMGSVCLLGIIFSAGVYRAGKQQMEE